VSLDDARARALRNAGRKSDEWRGRRDQLIREAYVNGGSLREIGEAAGLSHVAVMKIVHRLGQLEAHHLKPTSELSPSDIANIELVDPTQHREGRQP
jgi:transposase-like protein